MTRLKTLIAVGGVMTALGGWSVADAATFAFNFGKSAGCASCASSLAFTSSTSAGSLTATATGWSAKTLSSTPVSSKLYQDSYGLGVYNSLSGPGSDNSRFVDNSGAYDFVKFAFTDTTTKQAVDVKITKIALEICNDGDMSFGFGDAWTAGTTDISLNPKTDLGKGKTTWTIDFVNDPRYTQYAPQTLDDVWSIFASLHPSDAVYDNIKIRSIEVSSVPVPAAVWLFGSAMLGMMGIGYRRQAQQG